MWFNEIQHRERAIDEAHEGTCQWILETRQYAQWSAQPRQSWKHGLLWIKGNAGSGKSTIMKFVVEHLRRTSKTELTLPHFFNARGSELESSTEGMYRTLLVWLLERLPHDAIQELNSQYLVPMPKWPVPELVRLLKQAVSKFPTRQPITFLIDALDECDQDQARNMLEVFRSLVKHAHMTGQPLRVLFASRPYPHIGFEDASFINLREQNEHITDIEAYIEERLRIGASSRAQSIRTKLQFKAAGSFMWAKLVINILNKDRDAGNLAKLDERLDEIPEDIHELYSYTLIRYGDNLDETLIAFRWLLFSLRSMSVETFWAAVQQGLGRDHEDVQTDWNTLEKHDMAQYIIAISKGFIEVKDAIVQFIHESVRDFLLSKTFVQAFYKVQTIQEFKAQSHDLLKAWCTAELLAQESKIRGSSRTEGRNRLVSLYKYWSGRPEKHGLELWTCFWPWAAWSMIRHAEEAQKCGVDQMAFLSGLPTLIGPPFFVEADSDIWRTYSAVMEVLLLADCPALIAGTQTGTVRDGRREGQAIGFTSMNGFTSPIVLALSHGCLNTLRPFLKIYLQLEPRPVKVQTMLEQIITTWRPRMDLEYKQRLPGVLGLVRANSGLAIFALLVLASPSHLEPHLEALQERIGTLRPGVSEFLRVLHFFIDEQLHSDAIDYTDRETVNDIKRGRKCWGPDVEWKGTCDQIINLLER